MHAVDKIQQHRREILMELEGLEQIRRGSVTEQYVETAGQKGAVHRRGPYPLYTFKTKGRTVSRRIRADEATVYREQIAAGRRFQELTHELLQLGEALCEQGLRGDAEKKTPSI